MADQKLSELTAATPATGDLLYICDVSDVTDGPAGSSKKATVAGVLALGATVWGGIGGSIGNQTDLINYVVGSIAPVSSNLSSLQSYTVALANSLPGTYQPLDSDLSAIAALTTASFGRGLLTQADAAAARVTLAVATIAASVYYETPTATTLTLSAKAAFGFTIDQIRGLKTSAGTLTLAIQINGTNVTSLSALAVTTTPQDATATAAFTVAAGDRVTAVITSPSSAAGLEFTLKGTR